MSLICGGWPLRFSAKIAHATRDCETNPPFALYTRLMLNSSCQDIAYANLSHNPCIFLSYGLACVESNSARLLESTEPRQRPAAERGNAGLGSDGKLLRRRGHLSGAETLKILPERVYRATGTACVQSQIRPGRIMAQKRIAKGCFRTRGMAVLPDSPKGIVPKRESVAAPDMEVK